VAKPDPEVVKQASEQLKGMVERMAMKLVSLPIEQRAEHYKIVRESLREAAQVFNQPPELTEQFVDLNAKAIEALVKEIEAGGGAAGGKA
jgi:hemoglobin-like flavoprotein